MRRFPLVVALFVAFCVTAPAFAQGARATGTVRDVEGKPIKGATVRAINSQASPSEITSTTDDKGRWAMIGLRGGEWTFVAEAPGFNPLRATAQIRVSGTPPLTFTLARDLGPIPGSLDRNILQLLAAADQTRDRGDHLQALAAYQQIRAQNPKLTALNLSIADVFRRQAAIETDPAVRRALLDRAIEAYTLILNDETTGKRAASELQSTRAEVSALSR